MTAPLYRLQEGTLDGVTPGSPIVLDGAEGHHAVTVKRAAIGDHILLADGGSRVASGRVTRIGAGSLTVLVDDLTPATYDGPRFVLVQALAKGDRDLQAIEAATELGVDEVIPWQAERSIVQWKGERAQRSLRKWISLAEAAAKQSRRPTVPVVAPPVSLRSLVERVERSQAVFVLHEEADRPLASADLPDTGEVVLVVGPEGGISPRELDELAAAGGIPVRMGRYVLRSSSAGPAALAVLSAASRWRDA